MADFVSTPSRLRFAVTIALLFAGTVLLYARAAHFGFLNYDDPGYVTANPQVQGGLTWAGVVWAFTSPADYWHPLTWLSHMLDWQLYGANAAGHHLTSILWHALNAVLVFLLFRRLLGSYWTSVLAAALFAWHPLRVESVAWVTERKDVLSGCFFLLTLLAYARYVEARKVTSPPAASAARRWYVGTLVCFVGGLMSKPMLVTTPVILLLLDVWPFRRGGGWREWRGVLTEKVPMFVFSGVTSVVTILMQRHTGAFVLEIPMGARMANALVSIARYLAKAFWPVDLIICYPHPGHWPVLAVLGAALLVIGLTWLGWSQRHVRPSLWVGWLWFVVMLLPVLGLLQVGFQAMADRYTYLSLLGIEFAVLGTVGPLLDSPHWRLPLAGAGVLLVFALAVRTWTQERYWRDSVTLFAHAVAVTDQSPIAEDFLASALFAAGRFDEAVGHAERARALDNRNPGPLVTLGGIRQRQGRPHEAIRLYESALALKPSDGPLQMELGLLQLQVGATSAARARMTSALRATPRLTARTLEIAGGALQRHDVTTAGFLYELIVAVVPANAEAHVGLGTARILRGDRSGGIAEWRRAFALDPNFPGLREQLAALPPER